MIRALALAVFLLPIHQANAFRELFDTETVVPPAEYAEFFEIPGQQPVPDVMACNYVFGWGRGTVSIINLETKHKSECNFSHTERIQIPTTSTSYRQAIFFQHYTCTDGSRAFYSTNWLGGEFFLRHTLQADFPSLKCN